MRPLRYSINTTLDGCVDHEAVPGSEEMHQHHAANLGRADALLFGRITWQMMSDGFRHVAPGEDVFADTINEAQKYVVSTTLSDVDWNSSLVTGDLESFVRDLKSQPGSGIATGGVQLPGALAALGLIDEYEFVVHPYVAGHGPYLLEGVSLKLQLVDRTEFASGAVAMRYVEIS
ncbi:MAG: deaminase [Myxococcaceae bacterium]|nr:MAG: deaminase [Myxococcaceae bacterium]